MLQVFGSKVRVESVAKVADLELAEKVSDSNHLDCHSKFPRLFVKIKRLV